MNYIITDRSGHTYMTTDLALTEQDKLMRIFTAHRIGDILTIDVYAVPEKPGAATTKLHIHGTDIVSLREID